MSGSNRHEFYAIGEQVRKFRSTIDAEVECGVVLQAALADLVGEASGLLMPLKDLFSRQKLLEYKFQDGEVTATILRQSLLAELRPYYTKEVINALCSVLNGYLNIDDKDISRNAGVQNIGRYLNVNQKEDTFGQATPGLRSGRKEVNNWLQNERVAEPNKSLSRSMNSGRKREKLLIAIALATTFSTIAWKSSLICRLTGFCPEYLATELSRNELKEARKTLDSVNQSDSLSALQGLRGRLQTLLPSLREQPLTYSQRKTLNEIESEFRLFEKRVDSEISNSSLLRNVQNLIDAANADQGGRRVSLINKAKDQHKKISLTEQSILVGEYARITQLLKEEAGRDPSSVARKSIPEYNSPAPALTKNAWAVSRGARSPTSRTTPSAKKTTPDPSIINHCIPDPTLGQICGL